VLSEKLNNIPQFSGCYLFKDEKGQIIYVGMSKYLPKRVLSYFQKKHDDTKTQILVETIKDVDFIISSSEQEALLLEEDLIRTYKPKFNIKGKDDKSRKWSICFTDNNFPKLEIIRNKTDDRKSLDFTNGLICKEVYDIIHEIFPLRSCSYNLNSENIEKGKFKECLEFHMKRCDAPCVGNISNLQYSFIIRQVNKVFDLDFDKLKKELRTLIKKYSDNLEFERANMILHKLKSLELLQTKLNVIKVRKYSKNAFEIKKLLGLKKIPNIIEAFDNSHNQGDSNVAASVRFVNGEPNKTEYRKYNIKTVEGVDDYASFDEVISRRFKRLLNEKQQLPDLILIDGGRGQLNVAKKVFNELGLMDKVDLISVSKDKNHKSSLVHMTNGEVINMKENICFTLLGKIQEEVHRFVIKFHREKQSKKLLNNSY
jgi:excinuclease ABC subunit C